MLVVPLANYTQRVVVIDYGLSNLFSVCNTLRALGCDALVTRDPQVVVDADRVILPGVGAFGLGMQNLRELAMVDALHELVRLGTPLLGICLGMQLLADESCEHGDHEGLGIVPGSVRRLPSADGLRIPHIGWNSVSIVAAPQSSIYTGLRPAEDFYFVHSFHFDAEQATDVTGRCEYGGEFTASVQRGAVMGVQYHPEKSHRPGLTVLKNFLSLPAC